MPYFILMMITASLLAEVISINVTNNGNQQDIMVLKKDLVTLQDIVLEMNSTIQALTEKREESEQKVEAYQLIIKDLVATFNALRNSSQQELSNMNSSLKSMASQIHYTSLSFFDLQKIVTSLHKRQQDVSNPIAFTVSLSSSLSNYNNKKIIYDKIITNLGNGYDDNTGIFTSPSKGAYVFTWSTMSGTSSQDCYAYIYHNGNSMMASTSLERNNGFDEVASNTMVLSLKVGDLVWIGTGICTFCNGYPFTGFSGWKL